MVELCLPVGVESSIREAREMLSVFYSYIPIGLLEVLPPSIQDRPPRYKGRDELETLMASDNYLDWIKIRYANLVDETLDGVFSMWLICACPVKCFSDPHTKISACQYP